MRENKKPLVTLAVLNFNGLEKLKQTIPAILKQDYEPKEIFVLDNGSKDGSVEYLKQMKEIHLIEIEKNLGYGAGKNILVERSSGKYILMLDNDIFLPESNFLSDLLEEFLTLDNPAYLSALLIDSDKNYIDTGGMYFNRINRKIDLSNIYKTGIHKVPRYRGGINIFEKKTFEALGGFDQIYPMNIDDYDMSARAYLQGYSIYRTTNLLATHLGADRRQDLDSLCWRTQYYFCGFGRMIWKNYNSLNLIVWWPISSGWIVFKSLRMAVRYRSIRPLWSLVKSVAYFIRDFGDTLKQRKKIQKNRIVKQDIFLKSKT